MVAYKISVDTEPRRITLRQFKGPVVTGRIPDTTFREAVDVPIDFHVHCGEMSPALRTILLTVFGTGSARVIPPRREVREAFTIPAIGEIDVVTQTCSVSVAIGHGEAQAGIPIPVLLRIWIRTVRGRTRELDWLGDAPTRVSSQVDSSAIQWSGIRHAALERIANEHLKAWWEGDDLVGSCHRRAGESVRSHGPVMQ